MIPSTFTLTGVRPHVYPDGVRALILTGEQHTLTTELQGTYSTSRTVSVTVFLGRDNTWAEAITRALTEGPDDGPAEIRSNLAFYPTRALTEGEGE